MSIGILDMQVDNLVPSDFSEHEVLQNTAILDHVDEVHRLTNLGFYPIELSSDLGTLLPHTYTTNVIEELRDLIGTTGIRYTVHLPFWSAESSIFLEPIRKLSFQALINVIDRTLPLDPEIFVLHAMVLLQQSSMF